MVQSTPTVTVGQFDVVTPVNTMIVSTPVDTMIVSTPVDTMIVSTPSEGCDTTVLSTPTSQRRVVQRTDSTQGDTPNHSHLKRKRGKVDDQCHHLVAEERQKVKLDVEKRHLEIKKNQNGLQADSDSDLQGGSWNKKWAYRPERLILFCVGRTLNQMTEQLSICRVAAYALLDTTKHHVAN